jgi:hypothetical protein
MTTLTTQPELIASAAANVDEIRSAISAAHSAAAGQTTGLLAAAGDEVSVATASLFNTYGAECQAVLRQASAFHQQFAQALASAGIAYTEAEQAAAATLSGALGRVTSPIQALLGGTAANSAAAPVTSVAAFGLPTDGIPLITNSKIALIIGGSGLPIPSDSPGYVTNVFNNYVKPHFPTFIPTELFTPEGLYPFTGAKTLTINDSVSQGLTILNNTLVGTGEGQHGLLVPGSGNQVVVVGLSQSAIISSLEMQKLAAMGPNAPAAGDLSFILMGNQMTPNGGLLARFPGFPAGEPLQLKSLGITFYGATPQSTPYHTDMYTLQYDGYADFPRYPINVLSDLNAFLGIETVHGNYPTTDPSTIPSQNLVLLPGSVDSAAPGSHALNTNYYMITGNEIPLLAPLRGIPVIGNPIADLLKPDLTAIVNLGYGDPNYGYSTAPANEQTYFGLFPHYDQALLAQQLITGAQQGGNAFVADINAAASSFSLADASANFAHSVSSAAHTGGAAAQTFMTTLAASPVDTIITGLQTTTTNVSNTISGVGAAATELIQPTIDIANAVVTTLPAYDINLFLSGIQQAFDGDVLGGLQYALVAPIAADAALLTLAGGFQLVVVLNSVDGIVSAVG